MFVSRELRRKSIAEYLLYMWQVEDIIRACDCSLPLIRRRYLDGFDCTDEMREELVDWYGDLVRMMNGEGCRTGGHLQVNKVVMAQLVELNSMLLESARFPFYRSEYYRVLPFIVELRGRGSDSGVSEIETCFNALYGVMTLRLAGKAVSPGTEHAAKEIATFIGMLSDYYIKDREEPLDFG